ncbi:2-oxoacid:acceptor oxidoreductase subunit alpha [Hoeflea prorocentri]|uniref:2-oxoacid:acceptor oxidoreductase subunit alpha n=1 Tax=Hoeflea prorocentri TaxID=1922333 RepID=A0A9X3UG46_9HYPH|nr:2-oxoacid:acceptor oxidoreductase subunit alpha [Hoeflea prorocentri]MCY6380718.1 2-oxoacid:acceptor oxidoreductase subunit alpha [Hoeflea prorocentri]MDA5398518.1 2-oxoacid:acceptor oxidoreductase subunit alpha [Hoeflea prorocentri]
MNIASNKELQEQATAETVVVRLAGDSGDGIQVIGSQLGLASAMAENDLGTFPEYPSEVRAPVGTTYGVSAYQVHFGGRPIKTIGDEADMLVALNPAALKTNLDTLKKGGVILIDVGSFTQRNIEKAGYESSPLEDGSLNNYHLLDPDISKMTLEAVADTGLNRKASMRCKNFWALGLVYWLYGRDRSPTVEWLNRKFAANPDVAGANVAALNAGHAYGETMEATATNVARMDQPPGTYSFVTGYEALAWGLAAAAELSDRQLVFASYPITPASPLLHTLAKLSDIGVRTFQAEDEIAAICAAIGVSFAGGIGVTSSSGPGIALKQEAMSLAVSAELPLVIVNTQRAGPSTGMPTKTEQSDLNQALYGRHGESPLVVLAAGTPAECFDLAIEATRIALTYMTPVILLSDGFVANSSSPWTLPNMDSLKKIEVKNHTDTENFNPYHRDPDTLARSWAVPGTPGCEHRIGGIEKDYATGHISYEPDNHQKMTDVRAARIDGIAKSIPPLKPDQGEAEGEMAVVGWGSTYGPISRAISNLRARGLSVSHIHLTHIRPFAPNQNELLKGFRQILVPEMNSGQLVNLLKAEGCPHAEKLSKMTGRPFQVKEIEEAVMSRLEATDE